MRTCSFSSLLLMTAALFTVSFTSNAVYLHGDETKGKQENSGDGTTVSFNSFQMAKRKHHHSKHELQFNDSNLMVNQVLSKSQTAFSSLNIGLRDVDFGYKSVHPKNHLYAVAGVDGGVITADEWLWKGLARVEVPTKSWNMTSDSRYIMAFEGVYALTKAWSVFLGLGAETGMRATNVQPIIGAQYTWNDWIFHAVYPSPKIVYSGIKNYTFSLNIDTFFTAVRAHKVDGHKKGVAVYNGAGADFRIDYNFTKKISAWISLGQTFNSTVKVGNRNFHDKKTRDIKSAMYSQFGISYAL